MDERKDKSSGRGEKGNRRMGKGKEKEVGRRKRKIGDKINNEQKCE